MLWLLFLLLLSTEKRNDTSASQTEPLNPTGTTGRNLTIC